MEHENPPHRSEHAAGANGDRVYGQAFTLEIELVEQLPEQMQQEATLNSHSR